MRKAFWKFSVLKFKALNYWKPVHSSKVENHGSKAGLSFKAATKAGSKGKGY
jgi:hypothetical protein